MGEQRRRVRSVDASASAAFVLLGLPDGMLGTAWPSMLATFGAPVGDLGLLIGTTSLAALGPAVTVLALIVVAAELALNRLAPVRPH